MKEKSYARLLLSWIHDFLLFEGIYVLAAAAGHVRGRELGAFLLQGVFMIVPVAVSYIVIRRCRNLWIFLVFSAAAFWGMKTVSGNLLTGGLTAFVCLFRCYVRLKQGEIKRRMREFPGEAGAQMDKEVWEVPTLLDSPRAGYCLFFVLLYLGVIYVKGYELMDLMLGILGAEVCVCLAYTYLERQEGFIKDNVSVANLPAAAMKKIGTGILLFGVTGLILFMLPAVIYHEEPLAKLKLATEEIEIGSMVSYEEDTGSDPMMEELTALRAQAKEAPEWLKKILKALSALMVLITSCLVLKVIASAVRKAMESFADGGEDEIIFLREEEDERERKKRKAEGKEKEAFGSPDRRIRRMYKKLIKRNIKTKPFGNETPFELEGMAGLYEKGVTGAGEIHKLYEKARYGKEVCTKEEVRQYMEALSDLAVK